MLKKNLFDKVMGMAVFKIIHPFNTISFCFFQLCVFYFVRCACFTSQTDIILFLQQPAIGSKVMGLSKMRTVTNLTYIFICRRSLRFLLFHLFWDTIFIETLTNTHYVLKCRHICGYKDIQHSFIDWCKNWNFFLECFFVFHYFI